MSVELDGPFQARNQFPPFIPANQPGIESAALVDSFSVNLSHASVFAMKDAVAWAAHLDLELTELNLRYRKTLNNRTEFGIDVPFLRATGGFMDRPLAWYHRAFGFPDYGRSKRPRNQFLYEINKNGSPVIAGENDRAGFGDVRFTIKQQVLSQELIVTVMANVELPIGDARAGYGNGSVDAGVALLIDKRFGRDALWYANLGAIFPGDLKGYQTVALRDYAYAGTGVEYLFWPMLSVLGQVSIQASPYPDTGISKIDTPAIVLVLGGRYYAEKGSIELSLSEDPNTQGAPDFAFNLAWKARM